MGELRTQLKGKRKLRRIAAVAMVLALLLGVFAGYSASAAIGMFRVSVADNQHPDGQGGYAAEVTKNAFGVVTGVDGAMVVSKKEEVKLNQIFSAGSSDVSGLKSLKISIVDQSGNITVEAEEGSGWVIEGDGSGYTYSSSKSISAQDFTTLMNKIKVTCKDSNVEEAIKFALSGYSGQTPSALNQLGYSKNLSATKYSATLKFFSYASGSIDTDSVQMIFQNTEDDATNENADGKGHGAIAFNMYINDVGNAKFLRVGYRIKESNQTWDSDTETLYGLDQYYFAEDASSYDGAIAYSDLGDWDDDTHLITNPEPIPIYVTGLEGLDPEKEYDICGVVVTESDTDNVTTTETVKKIKYLPPVISTLNIGNTSAQLGGSTKEISASIEFSNRNYDNTEEGPKVAVQFYFTADRVSESGVDSSEWVKAGSQQILSPEKNEDGSYKTTITPDAVKYTLPSDKDSTKAAFKVVVTDLNASGYYDDDPEFGYSVTKYSDSTFVVDSSAPSVPTVTAEGSDLNLTGGEAVVGGSESNVTLKISGSKDSASGLKEYRYSMVYLETGKLSQFLTKYNTLSSESSNADILKVMSGLSESDNIVEYTAAATLEMQGSGDGRFATLTIAKDGFYCVKATAVDEVGKESGEAVALFRVDLTAPKAPTLTLVQQATASENITLNGGDLTVSNFKKYDNSTYSDETVWVFVQAAAEAGKAIAADKIEYTVDDGLTWTNITKAVNFAGKSAYSTKKFTYNSTTYLAAFQLSSKTVSGYKQVKVRVTDTLGNVSLPSDPADMRTTENITPTGTMTHETIEVAMAMGNTSLQNAGEIEDDLRNQIALKINEKYYGSDHKTNANNPIHALYEGETIHQCEWKDNATGICRFADCPYKKNEDLYTPSMVSVQGMSSANAATDSSFNWVRFDHTDYVEQSYDGDTGKEVTETTTNKVTVRIPTVVFDSDPMTEKLHTTANDIADKTQSTYKVDGQTRYTALTDYVVYTGQVANVDVNGNSITVNNLTETEQLRGGSWAGAVAADGKEVSDKVLLTPTYYFAEVAQFDAGENRLAHDTYTSVGGYLKNTAHGNGASAAVKRVYRLVDMTNITENKVSTLGTGDTEHLFTDEDGNYVKDEEGNYLTTTKTYPVSSLVQDENANKMETIYGVGYFYNSFRDWLFLFNGQSTRKEIFFSVDDSEVYPHSCDGFGFLFNTTIRQNIAGEWVISGYLFAMADMKPDRTEFEKYVIRMEDVRLDWFSNARITSNGDIPEITNTSDPRQFHWSGRFKELNQKEDGSFDYYNPSNYYEYDPSLTYSSTPWEYRERGIREQWQHEDFFYNIVQSALYEETFVGPTNDIPYTYDSSKLSDNQGKVTYTYTDSLGNQATQTIEVVARLAYDEGGTRNRNYVLVTEGADTQIYQWTADPEGSTNAEKREYLQNQFEADTTAGTDGTVPAEKTNEEGELDFTEGYKLLSWKAWDGENAYANDNPDLAASEKNASHLYTPAVTVDGYTVGDLSGYNDNQASLLANQPHTDSNTYGFGPITFARSIKHGCTRDTLVVFSNISMTVDKARSLSEVITEPKWGGGKVKYVLNISDDSISDLQDPILSANIVWRVTNEDVKFINWGSLTNKLETEEFIENKLDGEGKYVVSRVTTYDDQTVTNKITNEEEDALGQLSQTIQVADYIADEYYKSYGVTDTSKVQEEIGENIAQSGAVFSLENASKFTFHVTPEEYNDSTANEDFPSGRWYISYDSTGYANGVESYARFSDSLDLKVTAPGRYSVYFAPDKTQLDKLDPNSRSCIYDFIVGEAATANPVAYVDSNNQITVKDYSTDPDSGLITATPTYGEDENGKEIQLTGIVSSSWRWELAVPYIDPTTKEKSSVVVMKSDGWTTVERSKDSTMTSPYHGKTITQLTQAGTWVGDAKYYTGEDNEGNKPTISGSTYYYSSVPSGATITIYETVTEVNTLRQLKRNGKSGDSDNATLYYKQLDLVTSVAKSTNLVSASDAANMKPTAPVAKLDISATGMYDTASDGTEITVTRGTTHPQKEPITLSWELTLPDGTTVTLDSNGQNWEYNGITVLENRVAASFDTSTGQASGEWVITKKALSELLTTAGQNFSLRIIETVNRMYSDNTDSSTGKPYTSWSDGTTSAVKDQAGRTIYLTKDEKAPSLPNVTLTTQTKEGNNWNDSNYEASSYLDVSAGVDVEGAKRIKISISGSTDAEGSVGGYGYYFYSGSDPATATYYYMTSDHKLKTAGTGAEGAKKAVSEENRGILPAAGGTVYIDANSMYLDGNPITPTTSLNFAVFAYDNQKNSTNIASGAVVNLTGANETVRTKIENIKLASYKPMPVAMTAVNATGQTVASIGNDKETDNTQSPAVANLVGANTNVTVSFTPRQDWFMTAQNGVALSTYTKVTKADTIKALEAGTLNDGNTYGKYYTDSSGKADLTNKVTLSYKVEYKGPNDPSWATIEEKTGQDYSVTYSTASRNENQQTGDYKVTVKAVNRSGAVGYEQSLQFRVDRSAPPVPTVAVYDANEQPYTTNSWTKKATVQVTGKDDDYPGVYFKYSTDNGVNWTDTSKNNFEFELAETGVYNIRVKAIDAAGNESSSVDQKVLIDNSAPRVSPPNVSVTSVSHSVYAEMVVSLSQSFGGKVYAVKDEVVNAADQDVTVEPGKAAKFLIVPEEAYHVESIQAGEEACSTDALEQVTLQDANGKSYTGYALQLEKVEKDITLRVEFAEDAKAVSFMEQARQSSYNAVRQLRAAVPELYAAEDEGVIPLATYTLVIEENDHLMVETTLEEEGVITAGDEPVLYLTEEEGYRFVSMTVTRADGSSETVSVSELQKESGTGRYYYTLKNVTGDVGVSFTVEQKIVTKITIEAEGNGTIELNGKTVSGTYDTYVGDELAFTFTPRDGYVVTSVTVDDVTEESNLPGKTVTVTENMKLHVVFDVADTAEGKYAILNVVVNPSGGKVNGTISPSGTKTTDETGIETYAIKVVKDGEQTVLLKPNAGYKPSSVTYYPAGKTEDAETKSPIYDEVSGYYSVTVQSLRGTQNKLELSFINKTHKITTQAMAEEDGKQTTGGGKIAIGTSTLSSNTVVEGTDIPVTITPDVGYRIASVKLDGIEQGNVREFTIRAVSSDHKIEVTFLKREFGKAQTVHSMTVTAVGVSDGEDKLADKPYSFKLDTNSWSAFQASATIEYPNEEVEELEPNHAYTVAVRAQDSQQNVSSSEVKVGENAKTKYTLANMPTALDISSSDANDTNNSASKTVTVRVDSMGNPESTEYCVYYSERANMSGRKLARLTADGKNWSTLSGMVDGTGQLTVYNLAAGMTYYLQVAARNADGEPTEANDQNVLSVTLSPTAPPENTLYFEEQSAPGASVTLHWDDPDGEVSGFVIYRDGTQIAECTGDDRTYTDDATNLRGDSAYVYSYAYVNEAGVGARRSAVSEEYYEKAKATREAKAKLEELEEAESKDQNAIAAAKATLAAAEAAQKKLDDLADGSELYSELMTYPTFPSYFVKTQATALGSTTYEGQMVLRILPDSGSSARAQKYIVGLHAYEKNEETGAYTLVEDGTAYGKNGTEYQWRENVGLEQETRSTNSNGAVVQWNNLNTEWEYRVYVKEVRSTGKLSYDDSGAISDGYQSGGISIELEDRLQKVYIVNTSGYKYEYRNESVGDTLTSPALTEWTDETANAYTQAANNTYTGWNKSEDGLELSAYSGESDYIKFNKSPHLIFTNSTSAENFDYDAFFGTGKAANEELTAYGTRFVVAEKNGSTKVKLYMKVYDPDGPADGNLNYVVNGTWGGVKAKATIEGTKEKDAVGTSEASATECVLEFDFKNAPTGVYDDLKLTVSNGSTEVEPDITLPKVHVVVNQSQPTISASNGGGTKKIEAGRNYGMTSTLTVSANLSAKDADSLRKARLVLMHEQYGESTGKPLFTKLMDGQTLSTEEAKKIDDVVPAVSVYFSVDEASYQTALKKTGNNTEKVFPTEASGVTYYWVEKEVAFAHNLCEFLARDTGNNITAKLKAGDSAGTVYPMLAVSRFGKNEGNMTLRFQVMDAPSLTVQTEQTWAWLETTQKEYDALGIKNPTIQAVYDAAKLAGALNKDTMTPEDLGYKMSDLSYKIEDGKYYVFKLWDNLASISSREISSKVQVKTGMYDSINSAKVVMVPGDVDPSNGNAAAAPPTDGETVSGQTVKVADILLSGNTTLTNNSVANFRVKELETSTTYHMWVYYQVADPENNETLVWAHSQTSLAMTTDSDYAVSTVGFNPSGNNFDESQVDTAGMKYTATLIRSGDYGESDVTVKVKADYYKANEYGEYELDESGQKIRYEVGSAEYNLARKTAWLADANGEPVDEQEMTIQRTANQYGVQYKVRNTTDKQGHLILCLSLEITKSTGDGLNRLTTNAETFEIFVLDDESDVTSYTAGIDTEQSGELAARDDGNYAHEFKGLPVSYGSADASSLVLSIQNTGEGDLNNIQVELFKEDKKTPSTDFAFAATPSQNTLAAPTDPLSRAARSTVTIVPADGLADGIYNGWVRVSADHMKEKDYLWIHLYQVVGQATLKGTIYIGEKPTSTSEFAGVATVKVYGSDAASSVENRGAPLYEVETDENGSYEIPNILTGKTYYLVVERIGCSTYDGIVKNRKWNAAKSGTYQFDLQMAAGDVNNDGYVNGTDKTEMESYLNHTLAEAEAELEKAKEAENAEEIARLETVVDGIRRCDLDQNGGVNAVDYMLLWGNLNRGSSSWPMYDDSIVTVPRFISD